MKMFRFQSRVAFSVTILWTEMSTTDMFRDSGYTDSRCLHNWRHRKSHVALGRGKLNTSVVVAAAISNEGDKSPSEYSVECFFLLLAFFSFDGLVALRRRYLYVTRVRCDVKELCRSVPARFCMSGPSNR